MDLRVAVTFSFCGHAWNFAFFPVFCQGSDGELRGEKDGMSDNESKVDSGVPEVPVPPDDTPEVLNKALSGLSSRYRHPAKMNVWNRLFSKLLLHVLFT